MIFSVEIGGRLYRIENGEPLNLAIPLAFDGAQPNAYGVERATARACEAGDLIGDTRRGGSCNFERVKFIPQCNGTHTESIGHITRERISVHECLRDVFVPATLVSVAPEAATETSETYAVEFAESDLLITRRALEKSLFEPTERDSADISKKDFFEALIVRTLPNDEGKLTRTYLEKIPPFFSAEAMEFIVAAGVRHLLVDLPSIDRLFDEGKLSNHRIFWNVAPGSFETRPASRINATITELIFAPDRIADGNYLLNLQIAPFVADAAPSRPTLFNVNAE